MGKNKLFEECHKQGMPHSVQKFFKNSDAAQASSDVSLAEMKLASFFAENNTFHF